MNFLQFQALAPLLFIVGILMNANIYFVFKISLLFLILSPKLDKIFLRFIIFFILGLLKGTFDNYEQKPYSYKYTTFEADILDVKVKENKTYLLLNNFNYINNYDTNLLIKSDDRAIFPDTALMQIPNDSTKDYTKVKKIRAFGRFFLPICNAIEGKNQKKIAQGALKEIQIKEYKKESIKEYFRKKFEKYLTLEAKNICCAIFLGDIFCINNEIREEFNKAGVAHVLGVSILNLALILFLLYYFFYYLFATFCLKITNYIPLFLASKICSLISVIAYLLVIGIDYTLLRNFFTSFLAFSLIMFKKHNNIESLFYSAAIIVFFNSLAIYDIGFQLSFSGVLGIYAFENIKFKNIIFKNKVFLAVWITFCAGTFLSLVTIYNFQTISIQPYMGNLLIVPFLNIIIIPLVVFYMFSPSFLCKMISILINFGIKILFLLVKYTAKTSIIMRFHPINIKYLIFSLIFYIIFAIIKEKVRYILLFLTYFVFIIGLYNAKITGTFILINNYSISLVLDNKIIPYPRNNFMCKQWAQIYQLDVENGKNSEYFIKKNNKLIVCNKIGIILKDAENVNLNDGLKNYVFTFSDLANTHIISLV